MSNLEKSLDVVLGYAGKLNTMWDSSDYIQKQQLQKLIFPEGIYYSKKKYTCRTGRVNAVFLCMSQLAGKLGGNKNGENSLETNFPVFVERSGELSNFFVEDLIKTFSLTKDLFKKCVDAN